MILALNRVNFVIKHLLIGIEPESKWKREKWSTTHDLDVLNSQLLAVLWRKPIEIRKCQPINKILNTNSNESNKIENWERWPKYEAGENNQI